jgi:hypothetical protein
LKMSEQPDFVGAMGDRGREFVLRHFNRRQIAGDFWEFAAQV